ncbi:HAMP domain-containing histidine kinase [Abyssibius alkaniclasticus]|nr:HAMP domain-containing sensor histidine kinase [Abyssibius alkaniclasticus]UPH72592.1 HAMP domain-containing histidine kinase [Abyssibius alkaniclasticus]
MFRTLTGRFLLLTIGFVMLAEVFIFVPSVARFRLTYLQGRLELAQLATLALLATPDEMVAPELADELLANAEVMNIVLRRNDLRELILSSPMTDPIDETFDIRDPGAITLIRDAMRIMFIGQDRTIRIIGQPVKNAGYEIETTLREAPLRAAMLTYGWNVFLLSLAISLMTAGLLFWAVRSLMVRPIRRVVANMRAYRENPEDQSLLISPSSTVIELREAESSLCELQTQLSQLLRQKERLAQLGGAVARVSHDLRNILTTTQLLADRLEQSADPTVARVSPKLLASLSRAINLCEHTLTYGRAEEPAPRLRLVALAPLVDEVVSSESLHAPDNLVISAEIDEGLRVNADSEQLFRILSNLVRNACEAIVNAGQPGRITIKAAQNGAMTEIFLTDTGPGLPLRTRDKLFRPFEGSARKGGTGLGLAIAAELSRNHGGTLELIETGASGTTFRLSLPADSMAKGGN